MPDQGVFTDKLHRSHLTFYNYDHRTKDIILPKWNVHFWRFRQHCVVYEIWDVLGSVFIWILIFQELNVSVSFCKIYNTVNNISIAYTRRMILESQRSPSNGASISINFLSQPIPEYCRFINRTACFPRKVSYFLESRMSPWKKWSWMKSNSEDRRLTVFLFTIRPFLWFYNR